jgi:hypothetical protein
VDNPSPTPEVFNKEDIYELPITEQLIVDNPSPTPEVFNKEDMYELPVTKNTVAITQNLPDKTENNSTSKISSFTNQVFQFFMNILYEILNMFANLFSFSFGLVK